MKRIERLVVHVEEAIRQVRIGDEPHLRLALILLDSAAELLMLRECEQHFWEADVYNSIERTYVNVQEHTGKDFSKELARLRAITLSRSKRRSIERNFNTKCDFLSEKEVLAAPQARVMRKLHAYRNELYHRDEVREGTISSAARIYLSLVLTMMRSLSPIGEVYTSDGVPPSLRRYVPDGTPYFAGLGFQEGIARQLLDSTEDLSLQQIGPILAEHVGDRLVAIEESASAPLGWIGGDDWTVATVVKFVQLSENQQLRLRTAREVQSARTAYDMDDFTRWREASRALESETDMVDAFAKFADLEDEFEPLECLVMELELAIDQEIQQQLDISRGK